MSKRPHIPSDAELQVAAIERRFGRLLSLEEKLELSVHAQEPYEESLDDAPSELTKAEALALATETNEANQAIERLQRELVELSSKHETLKMSMQSLTAQRDQLYQMLENESGLWSSFEAWRKRCPDEDLKKAEAAIRSERTERVNHHTAKLRALQGAERAPRKPKEAALAATFGAEKKR